MKNLKNIVNSDAAYEILDNSNCAGSTWTEGGCAILAQALNMLEGYPMYVIYNKRIGSSEHFGVMTPDGAILDADGEHNSTDAWLKFFKENEMPRAGELVVIPFDSGVDMEGINFDDDAAKELALLIKKHKMIRESVRSVIVESINSDRYTLIPYGEDIDLEEFGLDEYEAADRAGEIAKYGGVTILRGQELAAILLDTSSPEVIGGLWVSHDNDKFSFDIALDSSYQNMGLSSKLIDAAIDEYEIQKSMHDEMESDFKMEVDVINPKLAQILQKKYGFHIVGHLSQDRVLMSVNESLKEDVELKNISDDDEYWDRVKIIAKNKKGEEVGYAVLDMAISPDSEFAFMDDEHAYTDDEIEQHFPEDFAAKLEHLEVFPKFRKSGYGKELMDAVVKYVKSRDYKTLYLIASPIGVQPKISLDALSKFYSGYGFEVIKDFDNAHDMVAQLRESVGGIFMESSEEVWYHGTPDVREVEKEGGFTQRYINIDYVEDVDAWDMAQHNMQIAREEGDEDKYFDILGSVGEMRKHSKIRKPIFLTNVYSVAKTYSDKTAFDYQNAEEKVLKVRVKPGKGVTISAPGSRFRFINIDYVRRGFINAGVDPEELELIIRRLNYALGVKDGIKTDDIAAIGDWFGFDYIDVKGVLDSYEGGSTKSTVRMVFNPSDIEIVRNEEYNAINEFEQYISEVFNTINESDEPSPTFEWDVAKEKIDNSKRDVDTAEKAYEYLNWFLEKIKSLPKLIKLRLTKYVVMSILFLLGATTINSVVSDKAPEISQKIAMAINVPEEEAPEEVAIETPTSVSDSLIEFLKHEEGSIQHKGEPVLKAYKIGDGMVTVGWGHAEKVGSSNFKKGDVISYKKAEELLAKDIAEAKGGLDRLLGRWDEAGVEYEIDQGMYDAMTSMIFNMGIGNFLKSDFIQLVKSGNYNEAANEILTTNVSYPGHIPRREKEKEMFTSGENQVQQLAMKEVRKLVRKVLRESVIEEIIEDGFDAYHGSPKEIERFVDDFVGGEKANDAQGAGIYFATNQEDAAHYGDHIYKVYIKGKFLDRNAPIDSVDPEELVKLIKMKDDWEMNAQDYSEDPETGAYEAAHMAIQYNGDEAEAFQQIEADFYRYDSVEYVRNMTKLGYDGIIVDAPSDFVDDKHIIVFNPAAIEIRGKVQ